MNDYQIVRLKAIRMKSKEILEILKGEREEHKTEIEQMQDAEEFKKDPYGFLGISERD